MVDNVARNIADIYTRKINASISLCWYYSEKAQEIFRQYQAGNEYWNNQTGTAYNEVFAKAFKSTNEIGFLLAHNVEYGIYLELANDRKHEALWPIIKGLDKDFNESLRSIWSD